MARLPRVSVSTAIQYKNITMHLYQELKSGESVRKKTEMISTQAQQILKYNHCHQGKTTLGFLFCFPPVASPLLCPSPMNFSGGCSSGCDRPRLWWYFGIAGAFYVALRAVQTPCCYSWGKTIIPIAVVTIVPRVPRLIPINHHWLISSLCNRLLIWER